MLAFFTVLCHAAHSVGIVATLPSTANIRAVAKHMFSVADIDGDDEVSLEVLHVVVVAVVVAGGGGGAAAAAAAAAGACARVCVVSATGAHHRCMPFQEFTAWSSQHVDSSALLNAFKRVRRTASRSVDRRKLKRMDQQAEFDSGALERLAQLQARQETQALAVRIMEEAT